MQKKKRIVSPPCGMLIELNIETHDRAQPSVKGLSAARKFSSRTLPRFNASHGRVKTLSAPGEAAGIQLARVASDSRSAKRASSSERVSPLCQVGGRRLPHARSTQQHVFLSPASQSRRPRCSCANARRVRRTKRRARDRGVNFRSNVRNGKREEETREVGEEGRERKGATKKRKKERGRKKERISQARREINYNRRSSNTRSARMEETREKRRENREPRSTVCRCHRRREKRTRAFSERGIKGR